jgi:hypothetical protein
MKLSKFTPVGLVWFSDFLDSVRATGTGAVPEHILTDADFSTVVADVDVPDRQFDSRLEAAEFLDRLFTAAKLSDAERDAGLWAWLAARYFTVLCRTSRGVLKPGERARWILEATNFQRYYRHLLAGPYFIYRAHRDDPARARALLCGPVNAPGDVAEQLASRIELVSNRALVEVASRLYVDPTTGKLKRGAGGKGAGSPRRLAAVIDQFDLTWDLYGMSADGMLSLLPKEFARFNTP